MLNSTGLHCVLNQRAARARAFGEDGREKILSLAAFAQAKREITSWPGHAPTPLRCLSRLAARAGLGEILYKDEGKRFGIGSFKALGGAYAVLEVLRRHILATTHAAVSSRDLACGGSSDVTSRVTVTCATDGNHGRSVAWGARTFRCACVIYMPGVVSEGRSRAIEAYGAQVRRIDGTFDDAVRKAASDAAAQGWHVVSDTSADGSFEAPRDVMQGYCLIADEALSQCAGVPSHVFVQGGVGGLAAATCAYLWERCGSARPRLVVVEPHSADCILRSVHAGRPTPAEGALDTIMGGLACGEVSPLAWAILGPGADACVSIDDAAAADCMRLLAEGRCGDAPIVAGESGVAGLAALLLACADTRARVDLGLDGESRVLVIGTEGATDPDTWRAIVGRRPDDVLS
ncbi:MAG TPA: diaminopropionate ammonia-lyase [Xanthobacteraceae bacterium]|jgi:diaminopropionate ammonia-lyase